jgi:hypothetical protein
MIAESVPLPEELLRLEERHIGYFLRAVRQVGEKKSELYPEPQYFNLSLMSAALRLPETTRKLAARAGGIENYARRIKRVLSFTSAVQLNAILLLTTWGREMLRLESELAGISGFLHGAPLLADHQVAEVLDFTYRVLSIYREDGHAYPAADGAYGDNYAILPSAEVDKIAGLTEPMDGVRAQEVLGLLAATRALSFLMEAETRDALMMHGPYPVGSDGHKLILFECGDLHWSLFPNFPIPGGVRWHLPADPFPVANLGIALVLRDCAVTADRFGTLYINPLSPKNVVAAALLTRGTDEFRDDGLSTILLQEAASLRRRCDAIQSEMFLQAVQWDARQMLTAGAMEEQMIQLRMLAAAGFDRSELEAEQQAIIEFQERIWPYYFERILARSSGEVPFFQRLRAFAEGRLPALFLPLALD